MAEEVVVDLVAEEEMEEEEGEGFRDRGGQGDREDFNRELKVGFKIREDIKGDRVLVDINNSSSKVVAVDMAGHHKEDLWVGEVTKGVIEGWVGAAFKGFNHLLKGVQIRDQEGRPTVVIMVIVGHTKFRIDRINIK